jgi:hypothetical protein
MSQDLVENVPAYDIASSFAGEDRSFVERMAKLLFEAGVSVFYDRFEEVDLWGRDIAEHLLEVYTRKARFCVMFVSKHYIAKAWPRQGRRRAIARALQTTSPYILPARFDDSVVPGLPETVAYVDLRNTTAEDFVSKIMLKLQTAPPTPEHATRSTDAGSQGRPSALHQLMTPPPCDAEIWAPQMQVISISDYEWMHDTYRMMLDSDVPANRELTEQLKNPPYGIASLRFEFRAATLVSGLLPFHGVIESTEAIGRHFFVVTIQKQSQSVGVFSNFPTGIDAKKFCRALLLNEISEDKSVEDSPPYKVWKSLWSKPFDPKTPHCIVPGSPLPGYFKSYKDSPQEFNLYARAHLVGALLSGIIYRIESLDLCLSEGITVNFPGLATPNDQTTFGEPIEIRGRCNVDRDYYRESLASDTNET